MQGKTGEKGGDAAAGCRKENRIWSKTRNAV